VSAPSKSDLSQDAEVRLVPAQSPGYALWLANLAWQRATREALKPHDLTHMQYALLAGAWWLSDQGLAGTQRRIASYMGIDEQMVGQVAKRLETAGLVRRDRAERDARAREVNVTPSGMKILSAATDDMLRLDEEFFGQLGGSEATVVEGLRQIARSAYREPSTTGAI
jgi:DNA-binding MarR family transcriptional regulator